MSFYPSDYFITSQQDLSLNFSTSSTLKTSSKTDGIDISRHPAINQLLALGYEVGDRVTGRNIHVDTKSKDDKEYKANDWVGTLTKDNIIIQEYSWKGRKIGLNGEIHEDGLEWLRLENFTRQIYFNVNAGRTNEDVTRWYAFFFEEDYGSFEEQQAKIDDIPIKPTFQLQTRKSNHTYYAVWADETDDLVAWVEGQEELAYTIGSDPSVKDKPRLMRLDGFNHIKRFDDGRLDYVPCITIQRNPDAIYTIAEVKQALETFRAKKGLKPFSPKRFDGYQYTIQLLRQEVIGEAVKHDLFDPNFFRTCEDNEIDERLLRCKNWAKLIRKRIRDVECDDPTLAWTEPLKKVRDRKKVEYEYELIEGDTTEPVTVSLARDYCQHFTYKNSDWYQCKCPVHGGTSDNSLNINKLTGVLHCHGGCEHKDVEDWLRTEAKNSNDNRWNLQLWRGKTKVDEPNTNDLEVVRLNKLTLQKGWQRFELELEQHPWGKKISPNNAKKVPDQCTFVLKGKTGAGKTEFLSACKQERPKSAYIAPFPTIGVMKDACVPKRGKTNLELPIRDDIDQGQDIRNETDLALCYPSLWKLSGRNYDMISRHQVLIIDEVRTAIEFLLLSNECNPENKRPQNIKTFVDLLKNSDIVFVCDAYATTSEVEFILSYRPKHYPVLVAEMPTEPSEREVWEVSKKSTFLALIEQTISDGERVAIAADGQENLEALEKSLSALTIIKDGITSKPVVFRYDSTTAALEDQKKFLLDGNEYLIKNPVDVLLWSPSLGQGFSITVSDYFTKQFAWNVHFTPHKFQQLVRRLRPEIPLYYHVGGDKPKAKGCTSWFVNHQIRYLTTSTQDLEDILLVAKVNADGETLMALADKLKAIAYAGIEEADPVCTMLAVLRSRDSYFNTQRKEKIRQWLTEDGYLVKSYDELDDLTTDAYHNHREAKQEIKLFKAETLANAKPLTDEQAKELGRRRVKSQIEELQLNRYFFDKKFPGFIEELKNKPNVGGQEGVINFFFELQKDKHWINTVVNRWAWHNQEKVTNREFHKLTEVLRCFNNGVISIGDLLHIDHNYRKFASEVRFWEMFAPGKVVSNRDILKWAFRLESESDLNILMNYVNKDSFSRRTKAEFTKKFITPLGRKYIDGMNNYFRISIKAEPQYLLKCLTKNINYAIAKFGYTFLCEGGVTRFYKIQESENKCFSLWRELLEKALERNAKNLPPASVEPMQRKGSEGCITNRELYISPGADATPESLAAQGLQVPGWSNLDTPPNPPSVPDWRSLPEQKTLKSRLREVKDFGMLVDVLNFVPLEAVKAAAEDLPPEYDNVKRLVKFAVWDDARQKWVALPRYAHPGYAKSLRWIDAIAGTTQTRADRKVTPAPW